MFYKIQGNFGENRTILFDKRNSDIYNELVISRNQDSEI